MVSVVLACMVGVLFGIGAFTFWYGEGYAYLSDRPEACINCHVMEEQFSSWVASSHSPGALCVDCHLPHPTVPKWISKAENGWFHSVAFTLQNFDEPIRIKSRNLAIVQENCAACHAGLVHQMLPATLRGESVSCEHCHRNAGHTAR